MIGVQIRGLRETAAVLDRYALGCRTAEADAVVVGTNLVYAYGQHQGTYRSGRLARRGGGTYFLTRAAAVVAPSAGPILAAALPNGPAAVGRAMEAIGFRVHAAAGPLAPIRTGALRQSIHTRAARRR